MNTKLITLWMVLATSLPLTGAATENASVVWGGTLLDVAPAQGVLQIDEKQFSTIPEAKVHNYDGSDSLRNLNSGQPVRFRLNKAGKITELWAYPSDAGKSRRSFPNPDTNH